MSIRSKPASILPRHKKDAPSSRKSNSRFGYHHHRNKQSGERKLRPETQRALNVKNEFVAAVAEFVGTILFLFLGLGGCNVANGGAVASTEEGQSSSTTGTLSGTVDTSKLLYISLSFGFALVVNAWAFYRVSGGLFNPAVSLGLCLIKAITPIRCVLLTISQILGGIVAAALVQALTPGGLNVRTTLSQGTNRAQGLFLEAFCTSILMLTILLLAAEKHRATFLAPVGIGLALFTAELLCVSYTGGSLNPARSFGPEVVGRTFASEHWIYWVGPYLGTLLAVGLYQFLNYMEYETVNPDQDGAVQGQAPIHVKVNKEGHMILDEEKHEPFHDPAAHIDQRVEAAVRQPSSDTIRTLDLVQSTSPTQETSRAGGPGVLNSA